MVNSYLSLTIILFKVELYEESEGVPINSFIIISPKKRFNADNHVIQPLSKKDNCIQLLEESLDK